MHDNASRLFLVAEELKWEFEDTAWLLHYSVYFNKWLLWCLGHAVVRALISPPHLIANNHLLGIKLHRPSHHNLGPPRDRLFLRDYLNVLWSFTWPWTSPHNLMDALGHSFTNLLRKLTMWHYVNLYSLENYHVSLICSVLNLIASLLFKIWI